MQGMHSGPVLLQVRYLLPSGYWCDPKALCPIWCAPVSPDSMMRPIHTHGKNQQFSSSVQILFVFYFKAGLWAAGSLFEAHFHPCLKSPRTRLNLATLRGFQTVQPICSQGRELL